jgi:arsenical pump membrane protein
MLLILHLSLAGLAVGAIAVGASSTSATAFVALLAGAAVAFGAPLGPAFQAVLPVLAYLAAALTLAAAAERAGLIQRAADRVARLAHGSTARLYAIVCVASALATAVVSLDGAVVLMVPLLLVRARRHGAPLAPLLLGTVAVANAASIAVPQGNPTNLVVIERLGIAPIDFLEHMLVPGLVAALACAVGGAVFERRALTLRYPVRAAAPSRSLSGAERHMLVALAAAALTACVAPLAGVVAATAALHA